MFWQDLLWCIALWTEECTRWDVLRLAIERNSSQCFIRRLAGAKSEDHISKQLASFCLCSSEQKQHNRQGCAKTNWLKYKIEHYWFSVTKSSWPHIPTIDIHAPLTFNIEILYIEYFQPHHTIVELFPSGLYQFLICWWIKAFSDIT